MANPRFKCAQRIEGNYNGQTSFEEFAVEFSHTGNLEVFHLLLLKYCPKRLHFSFYGMIARTQLAILHFNQAMKAGHAITKNNIPRYKLQFSKVSQAYVVKAIRKPPEKKYIDDLMSEVVNLTKFEDHVVNLPILPDIPQSASATEKPDKNEMIKQKRTRFLTS